MQVAKSGATSIINNNLCDCVLRVYNYESHYEQNAPAWLSMFPPTPPSKKPKKILHVYFTKQAIFLYICCSNDSDPKAAGFTRLR